ncbi:MAG: hypothetical protein ACREBE_21780 [bacterium]
MLEPNDLPLVCIPLELPPQAAAELIDFLHQLTAALERHYVGELHRHYQDLASAQRPAATTADDDDSPF